MGADPKRRRSAALPASKRLCLEETDSISRKQCLATVEQAVDLLDTSDTGKEMLRLLIKGSFGCAAQEQHRYQQAAAEMVKEAFEDAEEALRARSRATVQEAERQKGCLEEKASVLRAAKEEFASAISAFRDAKAAFLADNQMLQQKRQMLDAAKEEMNKCRSKLKEVTGCKQQLTDALERHMPAIMKGVPDVQLHIQEVSLLLVEVPLEDSLKTAAASSLKLSAEMRGSFDKAVLEQLCAALSKTLKAVPSAENEQKAVEDAQAVERAAMTAFAEARQAQTRSAHELRLAELQIRSAQGAEGTALECLREKEQELKQTEKQVQADQESLRQFHDGPVAALKVLEFPTIQVSSKDLSQGKQDSHAHDPASAGVPTPVRAAAIP